jgi:hypothetical protein
MEHDVPDRGARPTESGTAGDDPLGDLTPNGQRQGDQRSDEPFGPRGSESTRYHANNSHDLDPETMGQGVVEDVFEQTARAPVPALGKNDSNGR